MRMYDFYIGPERIAELFTEVREMREHFPHECLADDILWSDHTERGSNAVTRDRSGVACHTIYIHSPTGYEVYYSMREDSISLRRSKLFTTITDLISPYEALQKPLKTEEGL